MSKTLGQIGCDAFAAKLASPTGGLVCPWMQYGELGQQSWESAASAIRNAVLEEAAKIAEDGADGNCMGGEVWICTLIAKQIRALKHGD